MPRGHRLIAFMVAALAGAGAADTWCGKNYMASDPIVPPAGHFPVTPVSTTPLLAFRCAQVIKPYLPEDALAPAGFIIDTPLTFSMIDGAQAIHLPHDARGRVDVTVKVGGKHVASGRVPLNATGTELPFSLRSLKPQKAPFDVECSATYGAQTFTAKTTLAYLPAPPRGRSVTKMDLRTGALLARPATGKAGQYETVFPVGFYTNFGGYLALNLSHVDEMKALGFNAIHPIPTFDNLTALSLLVEHMEEVGMYLIYDTARYMNHTAVTEEVNRIKDSPALLVWYTADEPDGKDDPRGETTKTHALIDDLDGYHPVSLVLNCDDYFFTEYAAGGDIVMQDAYAIGINATWSGPWGTPCTEDYGDCGCDNCKGEFEDVSTRMDKFAQRMDVDGWSRTKTLWTVPQGFGGESYWSRPPTGREFVVQSVLGINHGARGIVAWNAPTTTDITSGASILAKSLVRMKDYILNPAARFSHVVSDRVDVGMWTVGAKTLVLATNLNYRAATFELNKILPHGVGRVEQVLDSGARWGKGTIVLESVGTGGFILA